ncbi:hypothetical protein P3S67_027988 [Capsicum chacoense]
MFLGNLGAIYNAVFLAIYQTNKVSKSLQSRVHYNSMETRISLLILLFLVQYYTHSISLASSNETDQQALLAFRNFITSPSHFLASNWTKNTSFCSWFDVTCSSKRQRVVALALPDMQLQGTISSSLANFSFLSMLNLKNNSFHGGIPYGLDHLPHLRVIDVSIPTNLFQHRRVQVISLAFNKLGGEMWKGPWYVPELRVLNMGNNSLTVELQVLSISFNNITGEIPRNIGCLSKHEEFYIGDNPIKGTIPASLANISILQYVSCKRNCLEGPIPPELGKLSNLRQLGFGHNYNLIGQIPDAIFNISSLERIAVNFNNLSGTLPGTTGLHLPNLKELILGVNQIEGEFPLFITNVSKLEILDLSDNFFTGTIPTTLGNLHELRGLFLHSNQLTNEPREHELQFFNSLADCRMLQYLEVGSNPLNGVLPNSIGNLSSTTEVVRLADAHISGFIPANTGNISGLIFLDFQNNNLMGNIPAKIRKLKQLQGLFLQYNKFQGHIPEAVCHLSNLVKLFLQVNELYGQIPECIGNLSMLQDLYLGSNKFSSKIPLSLWKMSGLLYVDVSRNSIEGEVPPDVGELKAILELYLSSNNLSGAIPSRLGLCKRFDTECEVMRNVRHRNLDPVISTCSSEYIRAFVLQYMSNGSLENWLYREDCHLNLLQRTTVMLDAAMAIEYLHHDNETPIVHCNLKPSNVLLDEDMVAHVGDFGISKILAVSKSIAHTETLGTLGYIAPEYGSEGIVSTSGDVYSYGIILMEILTERLPTDEEICNENIYLRKWITQSFSGTMFEVVDANLFPEEEQITSKSEICIASMVELALDCTMEIPESRITMKDVVKRLNKIKNTFLEM